MSPEPGEMFRIVDMCLEMPMELPGNTVQMLGCFLTLFTTLFGLIWCGRA
jgi:hypothetical protein